MELERKVLGKISNVELKFNDRDFLVLQFELSGPGMGVDKAMSVNSIEFGNELEKLMKAAKVRELSKLKNTPVEMTIKYNTLISWRVLEEVL